MEESLDIRNVLDDGSSILWGLATRHENSGRDHRGDFVGRGGESHRAWRFLGCGRGSDPFLVPLVDLFSKELGLMRQNGCDKPVDEPDEDYRTRDEGGRELSKYFATELEGQPS